VPRLLPRDVPAFIGRGDELDRITGLAASGRVVVAVIGGTAGTGKTALAVHAAHQLLPKFPDGQLYADLRGFTDGQEPAEPDEVLEIFLRRLGVTGKEIPASLEGKSGLMRGLLSSRQVMMVLDNAASEAQVRPLLPGTGESLALVTSRSVLPGLEVNERISLDVLPDDEAAELLAAMIGIDLVAAEPDAVARVLECCGCLPLALRVAGQILAAHRAWPVERVAGMLTVEQDRIRELSVGDLQVRSAFMVSYQQLPEADARMFRRLGLHPGPDFDVSVAAVLAEIKLAEAGPVLRRLAEACLIIEDSAGRMKMHDLLRLFARGLCHDTDDQATQDAAQDHLIGWYTDLAISVGRCLDPQQSPAAAQAGTEFLSPREALRLFETERPNLLAILDMTVQFHQDKQVIQLSESMSDALMFLHYVADLRAVSEAALTAARRGADTTAEANALINLGAAYAELRRYEEAIDCFLSALVIVREARDWYQQGLILINLGTVYRDLRQFDKAIDCLQPALATVRDAGDRRNEVQTLINLSTVYRELQQVEEAIDCLQSALVIVQEAGDGHWMGLVLINLGIVYRELQQVEEAIDCLQSALVIVQEAGDRHGEGQALGYLGVTYTELRRFEEAISFYTQAQVIYQETGDQQGEGQTLGNLGVTYAELRQFEDAIGCFEKALMSYRETGDRYGEGMVLTNLGDAYLKLRKRDQAATCWQDAATAMRDVGESDEAARLEQMATAVTSSRRRRWRRD
jgi:tetratricopeptide (TPR) repeat protein